MQYAGRKFDGRRFDGRKSVDGSLWTKVQRTKVRGRKSDKSSWTEVRRKLDGSLWTKVQRTKVRRRTSDESWAEVQRTSDESPTYVERVELSHLCGNGGRRCYTAAPRNAVTMAGNAVARNVVTALASNAVLLRQCVGPCSGAATTTRWTLQRCCYDNALDLATLLRWPATRWTSQRCCDGRQRTRPHSGAAMSSSALQSRPTLSCKVFVFFSTPDNLKREKEWEKERSFDTCSLVSRLRLSQ